MASLEFLQLLARAVHRFRTYPATSPLCTDAVDACHGAFVALKLDKPMMLRVTSAQLLVDDEPLAADTIVDHELRRPLYLARVGSIEFDRSATARDWTTFCVLLAAAAQPARNGATLAERLLDAGIAAIVPRMTPQPEVFEIGAPQPPVLRMVHLERERQAAATVTGPAQYLYPPDKGWLRADLTLEDTSLSLVDLSLLVNDPRELATILGRLVDDPIGDPGHGDPLHDRYDDVVMVISALEPHVGRLLLAKLARAVLDLDVDRRRALLRRSILPHLLDGHIDGEAVLAEFPDVDLADALGLLFDLEAASPRMLSVALDRLQLPADRRSRVIPLIEDTLDGRRPSAVDRWAAAGFDQRALQLIRIEAAAAKNFGEFAAFDLSIDEATTASLAGVREAVTATDEEDVWLGCALALARIEPNPITVGALLTRALPVLQKFVRDDRWQDATRWLSRMAEVAASADSARPDVAAAVRAVLRQFCDRQAVMHLARVCGAEGRSTYAPLAIAALGSAIVPSWLDALAAPADRSHALRLRPFFCDCAPQTAPAIAAGLPELAPDSAMVAIAVLGYAGPGFETAIANRMADADEALIREALRALARIGSTKAAALIAWQIENGTGTQAAAEEALWRLPAALALAKTRELLARREFVARHPRSASRLLERAAHSSDSQLESVLETLAPLRFHFWNPALARVGARARGLM